MFQTTMIICRPIWTTIRLLQSILLMLIVVSMRLEDAMNAVHYAKSVAGENPELPQADHVEQKTDDGSYQH